VGQLVRALPGGDALARCAVGGLGRRGAPDRAHVGESPERIRRFARQSGLTLTVWRAPGTVLRAWRLKLLPTTLLLDAAGNPRLQVSGARDWTDAASRRAIASLAAPGSRP
jgi:hypothetical protein